MILKKRVPGLVRLRATGCLTRAALGTQRIGHHNIIVCIQDTKRVNLAQCIQIPNVTRLPDQSVVSPKSSGVFLNTQKSI